MPWVDVAEPYAKRPRVYEVRPSQGWEPPLAVDRGWGELSDTAVAAHSGFDPSELQELTIQESSLTDITLVSSAAASSNGQTLAVEVHRSKLEDCDLSQVTVRSMIASRVTGSKLTGTDFSGGKVSDTVFERCLLRYANLRMAKFNRVAFVDCTFEDVDAYQLEATDVSFAGSGLSAVNLDNLVATRVDFRDTTELSLSAVTSLSGCLVTEHQLAGLAHSLAMAAGLNVERLPD